MSVKIRCSSWLGNCVLLAERSVEQTNWPNECSPLGWSLDFEWTDFRIWQCQKQYLKSRRAMMGSVVQVFKSTMADFPPPQKPIILDVGGAK